MFNLTKISCFCACYLMLASRTMLTRLVDMGLSNCKTPARHLLDNRSTTGRQLLNTCKTRARHLLDTR